MSMALGHVSFSLFENYPVTKFINPPMYEGLRRLDTICHCYFAWKKKSRAHAALAMWHIAKAYHVKLQRFQLANSLDSLVYLYTVVMAVSPSNKVKGALFYLLLRSFRMIW